MKKILFVLPSVLVGGIETLFATLIKHLPRGFEYKVAAPKGINQSWLSCNLPNTSLYDVQSFNQSLTKLISDFDPDLIVGALNYNLSEALKLCSKHYPVMETSHSVLESARYSLNIIRPWLVHVVCVSSSVLQYISPIYNGPSSIILTGIDTNRFKPKDKFNPFVKNYAYFGRISECDKYINKLFQAFTKLSGSTLNVYGAAHTQKIQDDYNRSLHTSFRGAHIIFKGFVNNPEDHMVNNDVVVIRSEAEGFCNTAAEALACGVPLVTYNFGGLLDHLPPSACLKSNSQEKFEHDLRLVKDLSIRKRMIAEGLAFIHSTCNAENMAKQYFSLFQELLSHKIEVNTSRVSAICTQYSESIKHSMEEYADEVIIANYDGSGPTVNVTGSKVIVNAAEFGFKPLIRKLAKSRTVYTIYHGSFCAFSFKLFEEERGNLQSMLDMQMDGIIKRIGFVNEASAKFYKQLGYDTHWTPNIPMKYIGGTKAHGINIGVFSDISDIKNTVTAVSCALMIPGAVVHTIYPIEPVPGISKERIIVHGKLNKPALLKLMGYMNVTLMLSFSESYGLLVTQSMAVGTPCIVGPACLPLLAPEHHGMYVERLDSVDKIIEAINYCLLNKFDFRPQIDHLREIAFKQRGDFLT
jgi:glycosyltransferase involved in cell wall biosynthesis